MYSTIHSRSSSCGIEDYSGHCKQSKAIETVNRPASFRQDDKEEDVTKSCLTLPSFLTRRLQEKKKDNGRSSILPTPKFLFTRGRRKEEETAATGNVEVKAGSLEETKCISSSDSDSNLPTKLFRARKRSRILFPRSDGGGASSLAACIICRKDSAVPNLTDDHQPSLRQICTNHSIISTCNNNLNLDSQHDNSSTFSSPRIRLSSGLTGTSTKKCNQPTLSSQPAATKVNGTNKVQSRSNDGGLHATYQAAAVRFMNGIMKYCPTSMFENDSVNSLLDAVDYIHARHLNYRYHQTTRGKSSKNDILVSDGRRNIIRPYLTPIIISRRLLSDLAMLIRIRSSVTKSFDDDTDPNVYFISILSYCWSILRPLVVSRRQRKETPNTCWIPNSCEDVCNRNCTTFFRNGNQMDHIPLVSASSSLSCYEDEVITSTVQDPYYLKDSTCTQTTKTITSEETNSETLLTYCANSEEEELIEIEERSYSSHSYEDDDSSSDGNDTFSNDKDNISDDDYDSDGDSDDYDKLEDILFPGNMMLVQRPAQPDSNCPKYSLIDDLIVGTDKFQAILFFHTLNELMGYNIEQYRALKRSWRDGRTYAYPKTIHMEHLLETTICSNAAIHQVMYLERNLQHTNPFFTSFYRVLAAAFFSDVIDKFHASCITTQTQKNVHQHETNEPGIDHITLPRYAAAEFISDCIECCFRNLSDPKNCIDDITYAFADAWDVELSVLAMYNKIVRERVLAEVPIGIERKGQSYWYDSKTSQAYKWLQHFPSIGGAARSIISTHRLIQCLSNVYEPGTRLQSKSGYFGPLWDEDTNRAKRIPGDLDEFLMGEIMPHLLDICSNGLMSVNLAREDELLPLFVMIRQFIQHPDLPVPISLTFGIHTLLTSILEMQGNNDVQDLGITAQSCFEKFIEQLKILKVLDYPQGRAWSGNLDKLIALENLPMIRDPQPSESVFNRVVWNPVIGGMFLSYVTFFANIEGGATMIDSFGQLRMALHLCNALKQVGIVHEGRFPLLDTLECYFDGSKAVWQRYKPEQEEFVYRWWIAYGLTDDAARRLTEETRAAVKMQLKERLSFRSLQARNDTSIHRLAPIKPENLSKSFRRICLQDFSDVRDIYHTARQQREGRGTAFYEHAVRCNDTMDAMGDEQRLLSTNLISVGGILNEFTYNFVDEMGWKSEIEDIVRTTPEEIKFVRRSSGRRTKRDSGESSDQNFERYVMFMMFAQRILGVLDFGNIESGTDGDIFQELEKAVEYFERFFGPELRPNRILFFTPIEVETSEQEI